MTDTHFEQPPVSRRDILILLAIALATATITRLPVLPLSVVDWDESVYYIIGGNILDGLLPYQGGFDHKPVALYYAFALGHLILGGHVAGIRVMAILLVAATAFLISLLLRRASSAGNVAAGTAGALYAVLSAHNNGLATNTELLSNAYAMLAMVLLTGRQPGFMVPPARALSAGLVLGVMVNTNYLASVLAVGLCLAHAVTALTVRGWKLGLRISVTNGLAIILGAGIATTFLLLPIAIWSDLPGYFHDQMAYLSTYKDSPSISYAFGGVIYALSSYLFLIALVFAAILFLLFKKSRDEFLTSIDRIVAQQALIYLVFAAIACTLSGYFFPHYFMMLLPGLCLGAGLLLAQMPRDGALGRFCAVWLVLMAVISLATTTWTRHIYIRGAQGWRAWAAGNPPDVPSRIAAAIRPELAAGDLVYVYAYHPILYQLLGTRLPLKYFFPMHHLLARYGRDPVAEMTHVLAQAPKFVVAGTPPSESTYGAPSRILAAALEKDYRIVGRYSDEGVDDIRVYERK
jgi:hypothetical protein